MFLFALLLSYSLALLVVFGTTLPGLERNGDDRVRQRELAHVQIEGASGASLRPIATKASLMSWVETSAMTE